MNASGSSHLRGGRQQLCSVGKHPCPLPCLFPPTPVLSIQAHSGLQWHSLSPRESPTHPPAGDGPSEWHGCAQAPSECPEDFPPGPTIGDAPWSWVVQKMVFGGKEASFPASGPSPKALGSHCAVTAVSGYRSIPGSQRGGRNKPSASMVTWNNS